MNYTQWKWRRFVAEALVIVSSILLAFALDAWWDSAQLKKETEQLLRAVRLELDEVLAQGQNTASRNELVVAAADTILAAIREQSRPIRLPARLLDNLFRTPTTDAPSGALAVWFSADRVNLVPEMDVRELLAELPAAFEDATEEERAAADFVWATLIPELGGTVDLGPVLRSRFDRTLADSVWLPVNQYVTSLVEARRFMSVFILSEHRRRLVPVIEQLKAALDR